uniref:Uncharacterized protein n=1 Tax=Arundo donax TaxID=35708 RepID=A0A0A8YU91_ARUDO
MEHRRIGIQIYNKLRSTCLYIF